MSEINGSTISVELIKSDSYLVKSYEYDAENSMLALTILNNGERDFKAYARSKMENNVVHVDLIHDCHGNYTEIAEEWILNVDLKKLEYMYGFAFGPTATIHCAKGHAIENLPLPSHTCGPMF